MSATQDVLNHHLTCFAASDLEGTLSDYTDDSVIMTPQGVFKGLSEIRMFFENGYAEFGQPGTQFTMHKMLVDGEYAFIFWEAETATNRFEAASDTFVIRDGRILAQTFAAKVVPKADINSEVGTAYSGVDAA
jgi:ketosteroid isomerase-like protein